MIASPARAPLDETQRTRLAALADTLMPAGEGLPVPSEIGVHQDWIDRALEAVPMMERIVRAVLDTPGEPARVLDELRQQEPGSFDAFAFLVSGAYFMHPRVRQALGYQGPAVEANPPLDGEAEFYLGDGLLDPVLARGRIYRTVPGEP
ncbi:MAG: hypothetical protein U1F14_13160 [Steroidobacteraceae bacterium]